MENVATDASVVGLGERRPDISDPQAEFHSGVHGAVGFDVSRRTLIELIGADRAKFLHNFCTQDIQRLQPGHGCEAFVTNVKGRVVGHIFIFASENALIIDSVAGADTVLLAHLGRYLISEDVELHNRTVEYGKLLLTGPQATDVVQQLGGQVSDLQILQHTAFTLPPTEAAVFAARTDWFHAPAFLLFTERDAFPQLWAMVMENENARPGGLQPFEALRIAARFPLFGVDISDDHLAQEVDRTARAISFQKGCYLGQEPIARLDALGHVNRKLCGLHLTSGPLPERESRVWAAEEDREIGRITSAVMMPDDGRPRALAYLRSGFDIPGTSLRVQAGEAFLEATVVDSLSRDAGA